MLNIAPLKIKCDHIVLSGVCVYKYLYCIFQCGGFA